MLTTNQNRDDFSPFLSRIPSQPQSPNRSKVRQSFQFTSTGITSSSILNGKSTQAGESISQHTEVKLSFFNESIGNEQEIQNQNPHSSLFSNTFSPNTIANGNGSPLRISNSPNALSPSFQNNGIFQNLNAVHSPPSPSSFCSRFIPSRQHSPFQIPTTVISPNSGRSRRRLQFESVSDSMKKDPSLENQNIEEDQSLQPRDAYDDMLRKEFWTDQRILKFETKRPLTSRMVESPQKVLRERLAMHKGDENRISVSKRKISNTPIKILDAPALQDDFYLNLVDWGKGNILAVGLSDSVYLWNATTCKVVKLCTLSNNHITSVNWMQNGTTIAVGNTEGSVLLYDATKLKCTRTLSGHTARVGCLSWNGNLIASGSRDRTILSRDIRVPYSDQLDHHSIVKLSAHKQEVCGLEWSPDGKELASGGNDNKLFVWNPSQKKVPMLRFSEHQAAVKGIAWSPHQHGLLASGGGTADRCIRFWNTSSGCALNHIDTGSQVCNITWSENVNELVSTHGYSQNQIVVWKYPTMTSIATLTGHSYRVLYLSMSPDGQTIVTGAGDETLRLWNVFPPAKSSVSSSNFGYNITCVR